MRRITTYQHPALKCGVCIQYIKKSHGSNSVEVVNYVTRSVNIHKRTCTRSVSPRSPAIERVSRVARTRARFRNQQVSVTGILLYNAGHFLQVLEGHPRVLARMFRKIAADPRHTHVEQLALLAIDQRMFDKWFMGLLNLEERRDLDHGIFERFAEDVKFALASDSARASVITLLNEFRTVLACEPQAVN